MNKRQVLSISACILALATGIFAVRALWFSPVGPQESFEPSPPLPIPGLPNFVKVLSGPFTRKNLTFYLVHGEDSLTGKTPLTLEEAMARKLVIVHETGEVNELSIENVSASDEVFVQAGDIVKGGQQDRVLAVDLIVPARSGRMPIDSFCVESERWTPRGREPRAQFNSSAEYAPSKELKIAAKQSKSQSEVWDKVADSQKKLGAATNSNTASSVSRSSLPLTLENQNVRSDSGNYINFLSDIVEHKSDVIGMVMVINGEINSCDIYGSSALFQKLWPKLLKAAAVEAVAESPRDSQQNAVSDADIRTFFETAEKAPITEERTITDRVRMINREAEKSVFLTTLDRDIVLHRNYLMK
jgi:hypothetical protein